jgi:hypothetical protein
MSGRLNITPNLPDPDAFYAAFVDAHQGLSEATSELLNARLVLILANQIGDPAVLAEALALARSSLPVSAETATTTPKAG